MVQFFAEVSKLSDSLWEVYPHYDEVKTKAASAVMILQMVEYLRPLLEMDEMMFQCPTFFLFFLPIQIYLWLV